MSRGRHSAGVAARRLVAPVIAVLAVVALVGVLLFIGHRSVPSGHPATVAQSDMHAAGSLPGSSAATQPVGSSTPSPAHHARSQHPASARPAAHRSHRRHHAAPPADGGGAAGVVPVTVLNNSRIQGLAHEVAAEVQAHGWPIAQVGNFDGLLPETTLFYLPGQYAAATRFAAEFPGSAGVYRLEQRPAGLPGSGLTLVVTRYWES